MTPTATLETLETPQLRETPQILETPETTESVEDGVLEDLLVEEVSIDGMCGVY